MHDDARQRRRLTRTTDPRVIECLMGNCSDTLDVRQSGGAVGENPLPDLKNPRLVLFLTGDSLCDPNACIQALSGDTLVSAEGDSFHTEGFNISLDTLKEEIANAAG